jgi:hypothetical protein
MVNDTVIEKIKQLFAMAEHPNSNENEAAIALEKAQELLFRHNLTRGDIAGEVKDNTPSGIGEIDGTESNGYIWKRYLLSVLAKNSLCSTVVTPSKKQWHLFGSYDNVKAVLEMYHWIVPELESICLRAWKQYTGYEKAVSFKKSFYLGAISTINKRLAESLETFKAGPGTAIVVYNSEILKAAVGRVFPHLGHTSIRGRLSSDGYGAGTSAGNSIHLRPQRKLSGVMALGSGR